MLSKEKYLDILDKFEFFYEHNSKATANRKVTETVEKDRLDHFIRDLNYFRELVNVYFKPNNQFLTFKDLKKDMYLYDNDCTRKDDHICVIEYLDEYDCVVRMLSIGYRKSYRIDDFPEGRFIAINLQNKGYR